MCVYTLEMVIDLHHCTAVPPLSCDIHPLVCDVVYTLFSFILFVCFVFMCGCCADLLCFARELFFYYH